MITSKGIFNRYKGYKTIDGGFTKSIPYRFEDSEKIFINVLPKNFRLFSGLLNSVKNIKYLDVDELQKLSFPLDYWIWNEDWADEMFIKGYF